MLSPAGFGWVSQLVERESAIVLEPGKEYLVEARLLPLARAAGHADVEAYVTELRRASSPGVRAEVVDALTTNETSWFRDREPFDVLVRDVLPQVLETAHSDRRLRIWSAACSSGQEAYTVAMQLVDHLPAGWNADILATDISQTMLQRVTEGCYSQLEIGRGLPTPLMLRHFHRVGTQWQVSDQLRSMVRVQHVNLADALPKLPDFDIVLLRNVLIYFSADTKATILRRVRATTRPGGFLLLGGSETTHGLDPGWERVTFGRLGVYRNPATTSARATQTPVVVSAGTGGR